jgi:hypothetical protein
MSPSISSSSDCGLSVPTIATGQRCECIARLEIDAWSLDLHRLFGADQYLTTVDRTLVSASSHYNCELHGPCTLEFEIMFDPMAGHGQLMGYIDGERTIWYDISWVDLVPCVSM